MASDIAEDSSSEEETLSVLKRRASARLQFIKKKCKLCDDADVSDKESIIYEGSVWSELEETDQSEAALKHKTNDDLSASKFMPKKPKRQYYCMQCDSTFDTTSELRSHAVVHQVETSHKCEVCGRCFDKAFSLKMHETVHEQRELKCPLCDLVFMQKSILGIHLMTHERQEQCPSCPDKFHTKEQLNAHSRTHEHPRGLRHKPKSRKKRKSVLNSANASKNTVNLNMKSKDYNENDCLKRDELSYETECAIVCKMHKGRSIYDICRLYNVTPEVVNQIWEDRDKYKILKKNGKRTSKYFNNKLDTRVLEWFNEQRTSLKQVTGPMLQDIAEEIAKEVGFVQFNGSTKWLDRFKARYKITLRGQQVKRELPRQVFAPAPSKWKKAFFKEQWCNARLGFTDENIYTADEVGIYFNPSKGRIKKQYSKKYIHGCVKDRLSIFMCTNVTGSDKKKLLVCGLEDPLLDCHRDPDTLPVNYIRHSQAHFTTLMFEEYVKYWNMELQRSNNKALLIIDRAIIHTKMQLSHLKLVFVPLKASVGLIPIRNGIYAKFRDEFRRLLLQEKAINVFRGVDRNVTCIEALYMIEKAWERTPPEVIVKSFLSTGYDVAIYEHKPMDMPKVTENDEEEICTMLKNFDVEPYFTDLSHLDMYLTVDDKLVTGHGINTEPITEERDEILPISSEKPETDEREVAVRRNRAIEDLEIVRNYLRTTNASYQTYCNFMEIEDFFYKTPM